jgi:AraC family transcriptional regulator, regulatory protein of adaptative response / methylated-DNA-[protein]-cysteine methyltransferase
VNDVDKMMLIIRYKTYLASIKYKDNYLCNKQSIPMKNTHFKKQEQHQAKLMVAKVVTPLGVMIAGATGDGLFLLEFEDRPGLQGKIGDLKRLLNVGLLEGKNSHIIQAEEELREYFEGTRKQFHVSLITPGTDFQMKVWNSLKNIPYGVTISYEQQSENLGIPTAIRAIAHANGCNRISIIIPCHRVIGKSGKLTGYSGGIERKRWLLIHETTHNRKLIFPKFAPYPFES